MSLILKSDRTLTAPGSAPVRAYTLPSGYVRRFLTSAIPTDSGTVGSWSDGTGSGTALTTSSGTTAPTVATVGGIKALTFDGVSQGLSQLLPLNQPHSVAIVAKLDVLTSSAVQVILGDQDVVGVTDRANIFVSGAIGSRALRSTAGTTLASSATLTNEWCVILATYNGASSVIRVNSTETTGSVGSFPREGLSVGHYKNGSTPGKFAAAEVVAWPYALSVADRAATVAAMSDHYGI